MDRGRLESFSDGVFAVAITLLALNLTVAGPGHGRLLDLLGHSWPAFAAYVISFFTIGVIWVNHRSLFSGLGRVDRVLLFLNLLLLLFVVAIPFTTATLADYLTAGGSNAHVAAALYGAVMAGM
ncbi:MAG TPA: TMEM175 family protein, partial [Acidimicrobiales bacterium]